jgi:hypothetical protein
VIRTWDAGGEGWEERSHCVGVGERNFVSCSRDRETERERQRETFWHLPCPAVKLHCWIKRAAAAGCKNNASASINLLVRASGIATAVFNRNEEIMKKGMDTIN